LPQASEQPAETDGRQPQAGWGQIVADQHGHREEAGQGEQIQVVDPPRMTPVEQPEDEAGRGRDGDQQRMQCKRADEDDGQQTGDRVVQAAAGPCGGVG
jgi:hypothetical protein